MKIYTEEHAFMPERAHQADAGLDLKSPFPFAIPPKGSVTIKTGVHVLIPDGYVGMIKSKSGMNTLHGIQCEGVIDAGFTGQIIVKLQNLSSEPYSIKAKDKIAQLVILPVITPDLEPVTLEELEKEAADISSRKDQGWGSTGR